MTTYKVRTGSSEKVVEIEEASWGAAALLHLVLFLLCAGLMVAAAKALATSLKSLLPEAQANIAGVLLLYALLPLLLSYLYGRLLLAGNGLAVLYYHFLAVYGLIAASMLAFGVRKEPSLEKIIHACLAGSVVLAMGAWIVVCLLRREKRRRALAAAERERDARAREQEREEQILVQAEAILRAEALRQRQS